LKGRLGLMFAVGSTLPSGTLREKAPTCFFKVGIRGVDVLSPSGGSHHAILPYLLVFVGIFLFRRGCAACPLNSTLDPFLMSVPIRVFPWTQTCLSGCPRRRVGGLVWACNCVRFGGKFSLRVLLFDFFYGGLPVGDHWAVLLLNVSLAGFAVGCGFDDLAGPLKPCFGPSPLVCCLF